ncbi:MAG: 2',3'-cyclic-nucleotide 2'-phosphodiesterase, partial [Maritimibacter sp.]|nr:2',3'-cyclic-nucleotide 2'-phosphodiesterase [Maritimibacter sp.]
NAVVPLAAVPGIDAIVAGHAHQVFPCDAGTGWPAPVDVGRGRIHGVPVVAAGFWGSHLGIIDLTLARDPGNGHWRVRDARSEARPISRRDPGSGKVLAEVEPDPAILKMLERLHRTTLQKTCETVGRTRRRLHSYFAAVAPSSALDIVHRAMLWYTEGLVAG